MKAALIAIVFALAASAHGQQPPPPPMPPQQPQQVYLFPCWSPLRTLFGRPPRYSPYVPVGRPFTVTYQPVAPAQFVPMGGQP